MAPAYDSSSILTWLAQTDEELKVYIDESHMSYLPTYLGRADALHALGRGVAEPEVVLRELQQAAKVYKTNGPVFLAKWPREQFRRRRLEPLETAVLCGDHDLARALARLFAIEPMSLFAGIEPDDVSADVHELTPYFDTSDPGRIGDAMDLAGALAVFYWLGLGSVVSEDGEGFEIVRRRAARLYDDQGHLAGGAASGGIARIRTITETMAAMKPARPDLIVTGVLRHQAFHRAEHDKLAQREPAVAARGQGALDRTALALLAVASALEIDCGPALVAQGADPATLAYARRLGHTPPT